jgi:hypothetical protein
MIRKGISRGGKTLAPAGLAGVSSVLRKTLAILRAIECVWWLTLLTDINYAVTAIGNI